ncbi:MAG: hypothetical protein JNN12_11335 [Bacteroidetes Order II. Incertae sedis bacterium]|nr:hypothetical protein [Bacteroidetes Order II. bacterium]
MCYPCRLFFLLIVAFPFGLAAQPYKDVKSLLTAVTQKTGWAKWQTVKNIQVSSRVEYLKKVRTEVWQMPGQYYNKSITTSGGKSVTVTEVQTPEKTWRYEGDTKRTFSSAGLKGKIFPVHELTLLYDPGAKLAPNEVLKGKSCYVVTQPTRDKKFRHKFYFDQTTLLLVAVDWNYFDVNIDLQWYEDYRVMNGFWYPFREVINNRMTKVVNEVTFNVDTTGLFTMPR